MRSLLNIFLLFSFLMSSEACINSNKHSNTSGLFDLKKLEGRWEYLSDDTYQIEEWFMTGENELQGRGFVLEEGDTTFIEFLSIRESNGVLTYFAQISDMSSSEVVPFTLTSQTASSVQFSNFGQDFPKLIGYEIKSDSTMQSYIEGPRDGQSIRIMFNFEKQ
jgi:hypothetical protein